MEKIITVEITKHTIYATFKFKGEKGTIISIDVDSASCLPQRRRKFGEMFIGKDIELIKGDYDGAFK